MTEQLGGPVRPTTTLRLEGTADDLSVALRRLLTVTAGSMAERAQLEGALESRIVIEQAKGILAERLRLPMSEAFELLRTTARANNTRLRDLAECVVNHPGTPPALLTQLQGDLTTRPADRR
jgi:AmiR/NasT family two-component response regulator